MWNDLTMQQRADIISDAVKAGITNIEDIRKVYNDTTTPTEREIFSDGGWLNTAKTFIRRNEGFLAKPYADGPKGTGWRSVGYGFNDSGFRDKYPQGISKVYEKGITRAQAEKELDYILGNITSHLKKVYGNKWETFNDNQKAAIIDTYYQRPASVVGKNSAFLRAIQKGDPNAIGYLGVKGYDKRNKDRRALFGKPSFNIGYAEATPEITPQSLPQEQAISQNVAPAKQSLPLLLSPQYNDVVNAPQMEQLPDLALSPMPTREQLYIDYSPILLSRKPSSQKISKSIIPSYQDPYSIYDIVDNFYSTNKFSGGGALDEDSYPSRVASDVGEFAVGMVPIVGAGYDIYQAIKDPSWANIGIATASTLLDVANLASGGTAAAGVGAGKAALKAAIKGIGRQSLKQFGKNVVKAATTSVKDQVVGRATKQIAQQKAIEQGSNKVTHSMIRSAKREANQQVKKLFLKDIKQDAAEQFLFNTGQMGFQTENGRFIWQR